MRACQPKRGRYSTCFGDETSCTGCRDRSVRVGIRDFGENRVQEWLEKKNELPKDIQWHLIGHLQTNKVKHCIARASLIHSVDSLKLAQAIEKEAAAKNWIADCLIQVNTSGEASKFGASEHEAEKLVEEVLKLPNIQLKGLMTIGPLTEDESKIRKAFRDLRLLREKMAEQFPKSDFKFLSMGMSDDFEIAVEEGANLLRIGRAVFGERK